MRPIAAEIRDPEVRSAQRVAVADDPQAPDSSARATETAFLDVYDAHAHEVYAFFAYRVGTRADAEDLTQLVFERAIKSWHRFDRERGSPLAWLLAIGRNLLVDHHRRSRVRPVSFVGDLAALEADGPVGPPLEETTHGLDPELESALARLSERDRELIALRYGADLEGRAIAELTGLSLANVQQILSRARRQLRAALQPPAEPQMDGR